LPELLAAPAVELVRPVVKVLRADVVSGRDEVRRTAVPVPFPVVLFLIAASTSSDRPGTGSGVS
jgi:hypothetical protein